MSAPTTRASRRQAPTGRPEISRILQLRVMGADTECRRSRIGMMAKEDSDPASENRLRFVDNQIPTLSAVWRSKGEHGDGRLLESAATKLFHKLLLSAGA